MKKILLVPLLLLASPAWADATASHEKQIQADLDAIHKDNDSLRRDLDKLEQDRTTKAAAASTNSYGQEMSSSLSIGADKAAIQEKKAEKKIDQTILEHHENQTAAQ